MLYDPALEQGLQDRRPQRLVRMPDGPAAGRRRPQHHAAGEHDMLEAGGWIVFERAGQQVGAVAVTDVVKTRR